ncbi:MAG: molybdopterin molybdotransferase MoeA [Hyphomonadaceae bacterium]
MISVTQARALMLEHIAPLRSESVHLGDALGRTLAAPVTAARAQPPFRASAMDGYAVRSTDTPGHLEIITEIAAGQMPKQELGPRQAMRIFTGAPLPSGADAVVIQEHFRRDGTHIDAPGVAPNLHVRELGIDFAAGETLIDAGAVIDGPVLALAAAAGAATLAVTVRPRLFILSGGDEIVAPGSAPGPAQIFDSGSFGVAGFASSWGAAAQTNPPLRDEPSSIAAAIDDALTRSDAAVVIGGASVGDHDHARGALAAIGARLVFDGVAMRPGKPTWFAVRDGKPVLGLPGNPASALVAARLFLRPLLAQMLGGDVDASLATKTALLRVALGANGGREAFLRARLESDAAGQAWVSEFPNQDSSLLRPFARANCLIVRPISDEARRAGDAIQVLSLT